MIIYTDATLAIQAAVNQAPACVGYYMVPPENQESERREALRDIGRVSGWIVYDPINGAPVATVPELLCLAKDLLPMPLTPIGTEVLASVLRSAINKIISA
jgi:hypothetical protein